MHTLNFEQIKDILPQRFPYIMIDKVIELEPGKRIVAIKNITGNEIQFLGHFAPPFESIMPGTLIVEAMAQTGIFLFYSQKSTHKKLKYYLGSIDKCRFLHPVFPGDQLKIETTTLKISANIGIIKSEASVEGKLVSRAQLSFSVKE